MDEQDLFSGLTVSEIARKWGSKPGYVRYTALSLLRGMDKDDPRRSALVGFLGIRFGDVPLETRLRRYGPKRASDLGLSRGAVEREVKRGTIFVHRLVHLLPVTPPDQRYDVPWVEAVDKFVETYESFSVVAVLEYLGYPDFRSTDRNTEAAENYEGIAALLRAKGLEETDGVWTTPSSKSVSRNVTKGEVLEVLENHGGFLRMSAIASLVGTTPSRVRSVLRQLERTKKVIVHGQERNRRYMCRKI